MRGSQASGEPINLNYALLPTLMVCHSCLKFEYLVLTATTDIAQEYAFARSDHRIDQDDWEPPFLDASMVGATQGAIFKQYPWLLSLMQSLPDSFVTWLDPKMGSFFALQGVSILSSRKVLLFV